MDLDFVDQRAVARWSGNKFQIYRPINDTRQAIFVCVCGGGSSQTIFQNGLKTHPKRLAKVVTA